MIKPVLKAFGGQTQVSYPLDEIRYTANDGRLLEVDNFLPVLTSNEVMELKRTFDLRKFSFNPADKSGVWRYREFLPAYKPFDNIVTLFEGNTPVYDMPLCATYAGLDMLYAKHQGMNPTGSFKDNGMTTAVTMAKKLGAGMVACASTGNTSASMAAYAARCGMRSVVFIPDGQIAYGKLSQALDYGAITVQIDGDFDKAMNLVQEICADGSVYMLNSINPFRIEGQKTIMIELLHQLEWNIPDWIVVPGGNLGNISSFGKAFSELKACGFIDKIPRLAVVQAQGSAPLWNSIHNGTRVLVPVDAHTRATAIKIGNPVSFDKALFALDISGGVVESVTEEEIALAKSRIGAEGIGCEPASATTLAGCKKLVQAGIIKPSETVVCILTGHILKDPDFTVEFHQDELFADATRTSSVSGHKRISTGGFANKPIRLAADLETIRSYLKSIESHS